MDFLKTSTEDPTYFQELYHCTMHSKSTGSLDCFAHFDHLQPLDKYIWKIVGDKMDNRLLKDQLQDNKLVGGFKYVLCSPLPEVS